MRLGEVVVEEQGGGGGGESVPKNILVNENIVLSHRLKSIHLDLPLLLLPLASEPTLKMENS